MSSESSSGIGCGDNRRALEGLSGAWFMLGSGVGRGLLSTGVSGKTSMLAMISRILDRAGRVHVGRGRAREVVEYATLTPSTRTTRESIAHR